MLVVLALGELFGAWLLIHAIRFGDGWEVVGLVVLMGLIFEIILAILDISG